MAALNYNQLLQSIREGGLRVEPGGTIGYSQAPQQIPTVIGPSVTGQGYTYISPTGETRHEPAPERNTDAQSRIGVEPESVDVLNTDIYNRARDTATNTTNDAIQAALKVYEAKQQALRNRIPGLESARDLRLQGLDLGLQQFIQTAQREREARRLGFEKQRGEVEEQYTRAKRQTRATARSLARKLRNLFAGHGTLDSTQYRDYNIEQSTDIARAIADISREKAGKLSLIGEEEENIMQYYAEQILQQQQRVTLEKDKVRQETDALIQDVLSDIDLTDAQKVETIVNAQNSLQERLTQLDMEEAKLQQQAQEFQQNMALKQQELQQKSTSATYQSGMANMKSIKDANAIVQSYIERYNPSSDQVYNFAKQVFTQIGAPEYAEFYGGASREKELGLNFSGSPEAGSSARQYNLNSIENL